jgi:hypothetical protein
LIANGTLSKLFRESTTKINTIQTSLARSSQFYLTNQGFVGIASAAYCTVSTMPWSGERMMFGKLW